MPDVVCLGEVLLRLSAPGSHRLSTALQFDLTFGGAEANVAVQLTGFGATASLVTCLPENPMANRCLAELRGLGVDLQHVVRSGNRMGLYFLENGKGQRPATIVYDRAHSSMSETGAMTFDWKTIFAGARLFHWSGITPALSNNALQMCRLACAEAKAQGLTVSFDVNFRSKLWSPQQAAETLQPLMQHVDVCVCSEGDAADILGVSDESTNDEERWSAIAGKLSAKYGFRSVAMTCRKSECADRTSWRGLLHTNGRTIFSKNYEVEIADRVGAGDAFTGALLFGLLRSFPGGKAIDFAVAASALKHTIPGDYNRVTVAEVEALLTGSQGGRVLR